MPVQPYARTEPRMAYADEGVGPAVLLVHGWAAHGGFFCRSQDAPNWRVNHRVVTPTLRGHAGSESGGLKPLSSGDAGRGPIGTLIDALAILRPVGGAGLVDGGDGALVSRAETGKCGLQGAGR